MIDILITFVLTMILLLASLTFYGYWTLQRDLKEINK